MPSSTACRAEVQTCPFTLQPGLPVPGVEWCNWRGVSNGSGMEGLRGVFCVCHRVNVENLPVWCRGRLRRARPSCPSLRSSSTTSTRCASTWSRRSRCPSAISSRRRRCAPPAQVPVRQAGLRGTLALWPTLWPGRPCRPKNMQSPADRSQAACFSVQPDVEHHLRWRWPGPLHSMEWVC
jgi:hypothetical protein